MVIKADFEILCYSQEILVFAFIAFFSSCLCRVLSLFILFGVEFVNRGGNSLVLIIFYWEIHTEASIEPLLPECNHQAHITVTLRIKWVAL